MRDTRQCDPGRCPRLQRRRGSTPLETSRVPTQGRLDSIVYIIDSVLNIDVFYMYNRSAETGPDQGLRPISGSESGPTVSRESEFRSGNLESGHCPFSRRKDGPVLESGRVG